MSTASRSIQALVTAFVFSTPTVTNFTIDATDPMLSWCAKVLHHYLFQYRIAECTGTRATLLFTTTLPKFYPRVVYYYIIICTLLGMDRMAVKAHQHQTDIITTSAAVPSTKTFAGVFTIYHSAVFNVYSCLQCHLPWQLVHHGAQLESPQFVGIIHTARRRSCNSLGALSSGWSTRAGPHSLRNRSGIRATSSSTRPPSQPRQSRCWARVASTVSWTAGPARR